MKNGWVATIEKTAPNQKEPAHDVVRIWNARTGKLEHVVPLTCLHPRDGMLPTCGRKDPIIWGEFLASLA